MRGSSSSSMVTLQMSSARASAVTLSASRPVISASSWRARCASCPPDSRAGRRCRRAAWEASASTRSRRLRLDCSSVTARPSLARNWRCPREERRAHRSGRGRLGLFLSVRLEQLLELVDTGVDGALGLALGDPFGARRGDVLHDLGQARRFLRAQVEAGYGLGEAQVGVEARNHDPNVDPQHLDADERYAGEDVHHHPPVENRADHVGELALLPALNGASGAAGLHGLELAYLAS